MRARGATDARRFAVEFEIANYEDMVVERYGSLLPENVRRLTMRGVVNSGAARLVLPQAIAGKLGLQSRGEVKVRYADGRTAIRNTTVISVKLLGRSGIYTAIIEPRRRTALIGAIILEDLDLLVDSKNQRLFPRDPRRRICEIG
jgi:predicted aspartyl protease